MAEATAKSTMGSGASTFGEAFRRRVEMHPDRIAVRTVDDQVSLTWKELRDRVDRLAGGLAKLGLRRGDTIALMLNNRPEFAIADLAAATLGATPFSIYQTLPAEQIALRRRGCRGAHRDRRDRSPEELRRGAEESPGPRARDPRRRRAGRATP